MLADLHYARGLILWAQEQPEPALAAWRAALRADPQHPAASEALRQVREAGSATKPPSG